MTVQPGTKVRLPDGNTGKVLRQFRNGMWLVENHSPTRGFHAHWAWEMTDPEKGK